MSPVFADPTRPSSIWRLTWPYLIFYAAVVMLSLKQPFFWDGALHSKLAHWFTEQNFQRLIPPAQLDSGHPPFFALFLAGVWQALGRSLAASHLAMLPFILSIIWQMGLLVKRLLPAGLPQHAALILLCLEPTLLAQSTLISADVALVFFFLLGFTAILGSRSRLLLFLALTGLAALSLRGMFAIAGLAAVEGLLLFFRLKPLPGKWPDLFWPYLLAVLLMLSWYAFHFYHTGWWFSARVSNWSDQRGLANPGQVVKNVVITGWRLVDFGRIGLWLLLLAGLWRGARTGLFRDRELQRALLVAGVPLVVLAAGFVPFTNPIGHRYFMGSYILLTIGAVKVFFAVFPASRFRWLLIGAGALLISGHFWVYPDPIAKGWDSSLAYWPYARLRQQVDAYLDSARLAPAGIGTAFPLRYGSRYTFLTAGNREFKEKDLLRDPLILQTNLSNDFSDQELQDLKANWRLRKEWKSGQVYLRLYSRLPAR